MATGPDATRPERSHRIDAPLEPMVRQAFERDLRKQLERIYGSNPWLCTSEIDQGAARQAARVRAIGGQEVLAMGARPGVGPIEPSVGLVSLKTPTTGQLITDIRTAADALKNPPGHAMDAIDAWDPNRSARAIGGLSTTGGLLAGRRTFGARPESWAELEDKLAIEELWAEAGIAVAPSRQVSLDDPQAVADAHRELATDNGTVWAGDNSAGWHAGGEGTFWVPDEASVESTRRSLVDFRRARVMPFVEGVPCSIHGMVVPVGSDRSEVISFRPVELMMLRAPADRRFVYCRASSHWDPDPADRVAMQDVAMRIGRRLLARVGFRGAFTVDGVLGSGGFVPTEVNTRYGAALRHEQATVDGPPIDLYFVDLALMEGALEPVDAAVFERWVTANLDSQRWASGYLDITKTPAVERRSVVRRGDDGSLVVDELRDEYQHDRSEDERDLTTVATIGWGSVRDGGMLMIDGGPAIAVGPPTAPLLVEVLRAVDDHWGLGLRELVAARPVR